MRIMASLLFMAAVCVAPTAAQAQSSGLRIEQLQQVESRIFFTLQNTTELSGDVIMWVADGDREGCAVVVAVSARSAHALNFSCSGIGSEWVLGVNWIENRPDLAEGAIRLHP